MTDPELATAGANESPVPAIAIVRGAIAMPSVRAVLGAGSPAY